MPERVGCGLNICDQSLNVWISSFVAWPWTKQDLMLQVYFFKSAWIPAERVSLVINLLS